MITAPFLGRGPAFPFRIDPSTGGVQISEGRVDLVAIAYEYAPERWTIREGTASPANHISEAILHILCVMQGEYDVLPMFGSRVQYMIFDPNNEGSCAEFETWVEMATQRWEKRAQIPVPDGVQWNRTPSGIDDGEAPVKLTPTIIPSQVAGNLVAPFVTPRDARASEFPLGQMDENGHDWCSPYHGDEAVVNGQEKVLRIKPMRPHAAAADDQFYEVKPGDNWLRISYALYGDIRFWHWIMEYYVQDAAERGESSAAAEIMEDLVPATILRCPSRTRLLMELAA